MSNILTTKELAMYRQAVIDQFDSTPNGDGDDMLIIVDGIDDDRKYDRYTQIVNNLKTTRNLAGVQGGDLDVAVTVSTAGTGYVAGTQYPVAGGDGSGGSMVILTVGGSGEILTAECNNLGKGYATPTVDLTGDGDGLGVVALTSQAITGLNQVTVLDDMLASLT